MGGGGGVLEEEEGLFRADAVNEKDPERDRAIQVYTPEGDAPLSLYATVLSSRVVLSSGSRHRAGVRAEEEEEGSMLH